MRESVSLVGPKCCGKTLTGKELARILGVPFVDADERFVEMYGSVNEFVQKNGWERFREYEARILGQICAQYHDSQIVLTPGGGAVAHDQGDKYREQNAVRLRELGTVVYLLPGSNLEKSSRILTERLLADQKSAEQRPSLTGEEDQFKDMLETVKKRHPLYSAAANTIFYTRSKSVKEVAQDIAELMK